MIFLNKPWNLFISLYENIRVDFAFFIKTITNTFYTKKDKPTMRISYSQISLLTFPPVITLFLFQINNILLTEDGIRIATHAG